MRRFIDILAIIVIVFLGYTFRSEIERGALIAAKEFGIIAPCSRPISYSVGTFDPRFGISKEKFIQELKDATDLWETAADRNLFEYKDKGTLTINLVYDYRQASTVKLNTLGETIDSGKAGYNKLTAEYTLLKSKIMREKAEFEILIKQFESSRKRMSREEFESQREAIQEKRDTINADVDKLNALATRLNVLAKELNIKVEEYNTVGASTGEAFDEGEYVSDATGERINIYQYGDAVKLDRVLAHEFGHALGLEHVEGSQSIMYALNSGTLVQLTDQDISELVTACEL